MAGLKLHIINSPECINKQRNTENPNWVKEGSENSKQPNKSDSCPKTMDTNHDNQYLSKTEEKITSFEHIFFKTPFGTSKPKKIAYVKPQVKEVFEDPQDKQFKKVDTEESGVEGSQNSNHMTNVTLPLLQQDQDLEDDKFKCDQCGDNSRDMWELKEHFISKHGSEDLYHEFRRKKKQKTKMLMEKSRISNPGILEGSVNSSEESEEKPALVDKVGVRLDVTTFTCDQCDKSYHHLKSLIKHQKSRHSLLFTESDKIQELNKSNIESEHTEPTLAKMFMDNDSTMNKSLAELSEDMEEQNTESNNTFKEELLEKVIKAEDESRDRTEDGDIKKYKCEQCDNEYTNKDNVRRHFRKAHPNITEPIFEMQYEKSRKKKTLSCKTCKSCKADDCGVCLYCKDKPKFGGPSKLRQRCVRRICLESGMTAMKILMLKQLEKELTMSVQKKMLAKKNIMETFPKNTSEDRKKKKRNRIDKPEKEEKKESKEGLKLKIKLNTPFNSDSSEKWSSEILASEEEIKHKDECVTKRTNEESTQLNEIMNKKIKLESKYDVDTDITANLTTSEEVDELIKNEVDEILKMERSFRENMNEDLRTLIESDIDNGGELDLENKAGSHDEENPDLTFPVPPKTPKKYLENTIEKLKNRIEKAPQSILETDYFSEEKVIEMLLKESPTQKTETLLTQSPNSSVVGSEKLLEESSHSSKSAIQELETKETKDVNLGYEVGDIKMTEHANIITLHPSEFSDAAVIDPEIEKFEKLKLMSRRIVAGELSIRSASSFTGLGEGVVRCWLEAIQKVLE
eukprot:GFUD01021826.1.p1 GENE.GFUD01021826.1~~GFUD01021826.1.p1  ORF type:complete len:842 (+),score=260.83 GFUD01021826.1:135-2528(+)